MLKMLSSPEERKQQIINGSIMKTLILLSLPTLLYGVVQAIVPLADSYFINNCIGKEAGSAVSYSSSILPMINAPALGIGVAGSAIIGQLNGKGDYKKVDDVSLQMIVLATVIGIFMIPILIVMAGFLKNHVDASISQDVFTYLSLSSITLPLLYLEAVYNSIKNTNGESEKPLIRMTLLLIFKLLFNIPFIQTLKLGIPGAVASTFISNVLILFWMIQEMFLSKHPGRLSLKGFRLDKKIISLLFRTGIPSMLNYFIIFFGFFLITVQIEKYGTTVLNGQGIAGNIVLICYTVPQAFAMGVTTMVSMNIGAGNTKKAQKSCFYGNIASAATSIALAAAVTLLSNSLASAFTKDSGVVKVINEYLHICTFAVPAFGIIMVNMGAFNGLGKTSLSLIIGFFRIWVFRYFFMLATSPFLGYHSLFWGDFFSNYICAAITVVIALKIKWTSRLD